MDSTERFSNRVENYRLYRPGYPSRLIEFLRPFAGSAVADVGSGTGIFSRQLLDLGVEVYAVEPNLGMRQIAERDLSSDPRFHSLDQTASETGLADASVNLVTCAQSFHWFANQTAISEFRRILRAPKRAALIWNERRVDSSALHREYENLMSRYGRDSEEVAVRPNIAELVGEERVTLTTFENPQTIDLQTFIGRAVSSSYSPAEGDPRHDEFVAELNEIFERYQTQNRVSFDYETRLFVADL
ncbi:class I SAM-dependent methyltransferase [soil metagenome]